MPHFVNGELVPEELIQREVARISRDIFWQSIPDPAERSSQLRAAAERSAIDKILIEQLAINDPRPADPVALNRALEQMRAQWGCRGEIDETGMLSFLERQARIERANGELLAEAVPPTAKDVEEFYDTHRENFSSPELFRASHIVKYVNGEQDEAAALVGIEIALAELDAGVPFFTVADRRSDCSDRGGDLGQFPAGQMVEEFDEALRQLEPGQRSGVVRTPYGFHIVELREKTQAGVTPLEVVRPEIERVLTFARKHEAYSQAVGELRSHADIRWASAANPAACG